MRGFLKFAFIAVLIYLLVHFSRAWYLTPDTAIGENSPAWSEVVEGESLESAQFEGRHHLVHFWGSWCGPCRKSNRALGKSYAELKKLDPEFEIISVGIERDSGSWRRVIAKDGMDWPYHITHTREFNEPLAKVFGVREIPNYFLIGRGGKVLAVNPTVSELKKLIKS